MRPLIALIAVVAVAMMVSSFVARPREGGAVPDSSGTNNVGNTTPPAAAPKPPPVKLKTFDEVKQGAVPVEMKVEGRGAIVIEFYPKAAPKTVSHVVDLVKARFYDGILFHRVVPDFVVQAGDPASKTVKGSDIADISPEDVGTRFHLGEGGSGTNVPMEAVLPHDAMSVGLARSNAFDSGDSQFYINLKSNSSLNGNYCVFGRVIAGQDVVKSIRQGDRITSIRIK